MLHANPATLAIDPPPTARLARARVLIEGQLTMLTRLAEVGMAIVEAAGQAATAPGADGAARADAALAYSRAAKAVRMSIALQSRLLKDLAALDRDQRSEDRSLASRRRKRAQRIVEQAIEAEHAGDEDEDEIGRLRSDAWERLTDAPDADIAGRPFGEIVARICRDLGLSAEESAWALEVADNTEGFFSSLPFMGRVAAQPPDGAKEWNGDLNPVPPSVPIQGPP